MNKLRKIISNAWDVILAFALLIISYSEGEEETQEFAPEEKTPQKAPILTRTLNYTRKPLTPSAKYPRTSAKGKT